MKKYYTHKEEVAVIIPAFNEAKVIGTTLKAVLKIIKKKDLYVVNDGSRDKTATVARKVTHNVLTLPNQGKAHALNTAIEKFKLTKKYKYIFFVDADTSPDENFLTYALLHFQNDRHKKIVCVVGRVEGIGVNWISKYRQWEYYISHFIHKRAQANLKSILVVPGCATIYRSYIFDKVKIPYGTMTEDMDFTFLLHRMGYNNMIFEDKAVVYTQDPRNIKDFVKQITRWYTGFWQSVKKHEIPWHAQTLDLVVVLLAMEGIFNGLIVIFFLMSIIPIASLGKITIFKAPLYIDFFAFFLPTILWSSVSDRDYSKIRYVLHFYFLRLLSSLIFLKCYFAGFLSNQKDFVWDSNRYSLTEGGSQ